MSVFKHIPGGSHIREPFEVNASQSFQWTSGSSANIAGFSVNLAEEPPYNYPTGNGSQLGSETAGGYWSYPLHVSIRQTFFWDDVYQFYPSSSAFVWNIGSGYYGEGIRPGSFKIQLGGVSNYIQDDANHNLRVNRTGSVVGTVFYQFGVAVVDQDQASGVASIDADGISIQSGSIVTTTFLSVCDIYEHTVTCKLSPTDYQVSMNPTLFWTGSDSSSYFESIISSSNTPYITSVGLYNDFNELLAVAKLSRPITRQRWTDQTFVIKFDE